MPRSSQFLWGVCTDIYQDMFGASTPPLNFREAMKLGTTKKEQWFMEYYLSENEQLKILDYHCKKHHLTPYEKLRVEREVFTGSAPNSSLEKSK